MKRQLTLILALSLILCGCSQAESQSETAKAISTESSTTTSSTQSEDDGVYISANTMQRFDSYEALMDEYTKDRSSKYIYPLPEIVDTWEFKSATYCRSNYTLNYTDTANNVNITLEIGFDETYDNISQYFDGISFSMESSVPEIYDRYAVKYYTESDFYAIIGITGEENIRYTLLASDINDNSDPVALLKEYREILGL